MRFHFPRETRAARLKVALAQPGRTIRIEENCLVVTCEDGEAVKEFERQVVHALAIAGITGRYSLITPTLIHIYLEERQ